MSRTSVAVLAAIALAAPIAARADVPWREPHVLHERLAPDPREDLAMRVSIDGELPAALQTPSGIVGAPDPRSPPSATDPSYRTGSEHDVFVPDRDTRRPSVSDYDDPFTPSTAPFKRLEAFDAVRADYEAYVRDDRLVPMALGAPALPSEEEFYGDVVVDLESEARIRLPSVGPGAHVVRARLGIGSRDIPFSLLRDGADNWFLQPRAPATAPGTSDGRARFVMEIAAPKRAFGGPIADPAWGDLPFVPALPENVARDAAVVRSAIGIGHAMRPREVIARLVQYFRSFTDSDDPPRGSRSLYLDLALSKKGVCRHRAFAFLVTAQSAGIPARLAMNEAHAWVEVHDGTLWRRIDLGGAGQLTMPIHDPDRVAYEWPADPFAWPPGEVRGEQMVADARRSRAGGQGAGAASTLAASSPGAPALPPAGASPSSGSAPGLPALPHDDRPTSLVTLTVTKSDVQRGGPVDVRGSVRADHEACAHLAVELWLHGPAGGATKTILVGTLATDDQGDFAGHVVVPPSVVLGDYDIVARTSGDARCGASSE